MIDNIINKGWHFCNDVLSIELFLKNITDFTGMNYAIQHNILTPNKESSAKYTLSQIYGFNKYPFHTDGAQHKIPPRYILLLNQTEGHNKTKTLLKDGLSIANLHKSLFFNSIFQINGNGFKELSPIVNNRKVKGQSIFRYNPVIMRSIIKKKKDDINHVIESAREIEIDWLPKGYLAIDNWRMLHSREAISENKNSRIIERVEFYINSKYV